jgi:hypothetical protein
MQVAVKDSRSTCGSLYFPAVCATRRWIVERGERPFLLGRRSGLIEAGGSLIRGTPVKVGSSPDNAGTCWYCQTVRVRLARPGCVTRVNQWLTPRNECPAQIWWIGAGGAVRDPALWGSTPKPCAADGGEATLKVCGVGVARLPGYS